MVHMAPGIDDFSSATHQQPSGAGHAPALHFKEKLMFAANTYEVRLATEDDADALRRLAELDSRTPLAGRVLIGQIAGSPAAALSLERRPRRRRPVPPHRPPRRLPAQPGRRDPSVRGHPVAQRASARRAPHPRGIGRDEPVRPGRPQRRLTSPPGPEDTDAHSQPTETALEPRARRHRTHGTLGPGALNPARWSVDSDSRIPRDAPFPGNCWFRYRRQASGVTWQRIDVPVSER